MAGSRATAVRSAVAMVLLSSVLISVGSPSSAAPSRPQVVAAKAKLETLNRELEAAAERYNTARELLRRSQDQLTEARLAKSEAEDAVAAATSRLEERAVQAYMGAGSQAAILLSAESIAEFSDRLEYMGVLAQGDADLAAQASSARVRAGWAAQRFDAVVAEREQNARAMLSQLSDIQGLLQQQESLYQTLNAQYQDALAAQQAAAAQAQQEAQQTAADPGAGGDVSGGSGGGGFVPPPNASAAQTAIAAAKSVIGTQYIFGTADPNVGFDCSGLTMWAYAQAGISLPHSSQMQYDVLPHLSRDQLQPGDLIFFFNPIHHVAIYLGGNSMIDTVHPGADGAVAIRSVWWDLYYGAARPS